MTLGLKSILVSVFSVSTILVSSCGNKTNSLHNSQSSLPNKFKASITNGNTVSQDDNSKIRKSTVAIQNANGSRCTGVVLSDDTIATAAHCVVDFATDGFPIFLNQTSINPTGYFVVFDTLFPFTTTGELKYNEHKAAVVTKVFAMPDAWKGVQVNHLTGQFQLPEPLHALDDLAILKIDPKTPASSFGYEPAEISTAPLHEGQPLVIAGFGISQSGLRDYGVLKKADVNIGFQSTLGLNDTLKTLGTEGSSLEPFNNGLYSSTCQGDSGGPTYNLENGVFKLVAITSFGGTCGNPGELGNSQNVTLNEYTQWLSGGYLSASK